MSLDDLQATARVYQLLARCWLREIDMPLLEQLSQAPLADAFRAVGGEPPANHSLETLEGLAFDYCQLFLGPANHLPPYQSVWTRGQFQAAPTESMARFVDLAGCSPSRWDAMLDHLGVQLDLMQMILTASAATEPPSPEIATSFFTAHLRWPEPLLAAAEQRAHTSFYRSLVVVTRDFLRLQEINISMPE